MKSIKIYLRPVAYVLTVLILLQGCTVYRTSSVSLDQAVLSGEKVKLVTTNNKTETYKFIEGGNENYLGVKQLKGKYIKTPLEPDQVKEIRLRNKGLSTALTIGIPLVFIASTVLAASRTPIGVDFSDIEIPTKHQE